MAHKTIDLRVAETISDQIGRRAFLMLGTTQKVADEKSLLFNVRSSKAVNKVRVTLDLSDTYTVEFFKIGRAPRFDVKVVAEVEGVYFDQLHEIIERHTGLFTRI
jgi:hypothetical protein